MAIYDLKGKLNKPGQNPDILALADQVDFMANRLVNIHNAIQVFDDQLHIRLGEAEISLYKDGTIVISGNDISIMADKGEIEIKASGRIRIKGSKIVQN